MSSLSLFLISILFTIAYSHLFRYMAPYLGLLDKADDVRKKHIGTPALVGGIAIIMSVMTASLILSVSVPLWLAIGAILFLLLGVIDDAVNVRPIWKLGAQFIIVLGVVLFGGVQLASLGNLLGLGDISLGFMAVPITIIAILIFINAMNMMDGLDGLGGGVNLMMLCGIFLLHKLFIVDSAEQGLLLLLIFSLLGFLLFNMRNPWRKKAMIFLGDGGSLCLGFVIAWLSIDITQVKVNDGVSPMVIAWILSLPIFDLISVTVRRLREGHHPFKPDQRHIHHLLCHKGWTVNKAVPFLIFLTAIYGAIGIFGWYAGISDTLLFIGWVCALIGHFIWTMNLDKEEKTNKPKFIGLF